MAEHGSPSLTLRAAVEEYLAWLELDRHASPNTLDAYRRDLARFAAFAEAHGATRITEVDRDLLRAYQRSLSRRPAGGRRALAPSSRQRHLVSLRSLLRFAAREEWLPGDLGSTIDLPRLPERLPKPLDEADRLTLTEALGGDRSVDRRDRALILFLLSTGCRISEALGLDRQDWGHDHVVVRGKGDRERSVLITENARHAVDEYLAARTDASPALFVGLQPASRAATDNRLTPREPASSAAGWPRGSASRPSTRTGCGTPWGPSSRTGSGTPASPRRRSGTPVSPRWPGIRRSARRAGDRRSRRSRRQGCKATLGARATTRRPPTHAHSRGR
jgi:site-specific recombinase XerD